MCSLRAFPGAVASMFLPTGAAEEQPAAVSAMLVPGLWL